MVEFELSYGDGMAGRSYYLRLGGQTHPLNFNDFSMVEEEARAKAIEILAVRAPGLIQAAKTARWNWDGCM